ncbi:MAG: hydrogenase formation protein HypD [Candidatus Cloacimonetes bacterium]|nr:hydrogenase formation protein HypD [Candidatus Cloacimonadota bacterium]
MWNQFRNPELIGKITAKLQKSRTPMHIMEVCGTHTMAIGKWGIRRLLPDTISLISGPGCPVCVTPVSFIDELMKLKGVTICTFGDLLRVPGTKGTLEKARASGLVVKIVYSPMEALKLAKRKDVVLAGIGFETTVPGIALTIKKAAETGNKNFSVLPAFKTIPQALKTLLNAHDVHLNGFLLPGHVSVVIGRQAYDFLPRDYQVGGVVTGFEPVDILTAIHSLCMMAEQGKPEVLNSYKRVVSNKGNIAAQKIMNEVLEPSDAVWRGLGEIPDSGLSIRKEYSQYDALVKYGLEITDCEEKQGCRCGDVLQGKITPPKCPLFNTVCTPANPIGPCMVSSEGSCAAYYKYEQ